MVYRQDYRKFNVADKKQEWLVRVPSRPVQGGDSWSAYSDILGLVGCGETEDQAVKSLRDMVSIYCEILDREGLLESRLSEKRISILRVELVSQAETPINHGAGYISVNVIPHP